MVLLDADLVEAAVRAATAAPAHAWILLDRALEFLLAKQPPRSLEAGPLDKRVPGRGTFARAVPTVLSSLPRFAPPTPDADNDRLAAGGHAANVALAWFELGYDDPAAAFAAVAGRGGFGFKPGHHKQPL